MVTVFWDSVSVILVDFMSKGATINSYVYMDTSQKVKSKNTKSSTCFENVLRFYCNMTNARPHTSFKTREVISSFGWTISHPPYLPDLAPSDFHLFGPSKKV